ncbi:glycoside hydrolase family 13 protein [Agromyces mediolanus]|uniref:Alpha-glucosidase n=1 Tax=Agromyces mediolanus TaxID=41986 RepID=A0A918CJX6_AGRME|nr:glycoside hydrolase family 13 protein [Agromyces mediolanus]GGR29186.1 alpha-glucosidase [Agromyces mediolanus]GLJ72180.1 alpha-glucosidase [Agromyces mediolanus]
MTSEWWRTAVIYQIYPRSFADANGDGMGDLAGITSRLGALAELGVDAIWLSPFYTSPQHDAGYDVADYRDVDPLFGTLADFDAMLAEAHARGIRVIVDLVPNHSSNEHAWFQAALAAGPGSAERARYLFRDGRGAAGELPPNNWDSVFGGPAWTRVTEADGQPGQWYLHLFDSSQPDFDWTNDEVREEFRDILRFWLDRGVDGFRVDVAHGLIKAEGLPDWTPPAEGGSMGGAGGLADDAPGAERPVPSAEPGVALEPDISSEPGDAPPFWAQDGVHEIYRDWRALLDGYSGERILAAEAWVDPLARVAQWVRPDEMHQSFNFAYLETPWRAAALRRVVDESLAAFGAVGAPSTWVLSNHDVVRHPTRLALTVGNLQGHGVGPRTPGIGDPATGLRRARAATALMLALPGSAYLYQGEELGLPEAIDLPDDARQDPTWFRTNGERYGRDGCRVPIPWEAGSPSFGFGPSDASWLPQPAEWADYARDRQHDAPGSTLSMYRAALRLRREHALANGTLEWIETPDAPDLVAFTNGALLVVANTGDTTVSLAQVLPDEHAAAAAAQPLLASGDVARGILPADTTVWLAR